MRQRKGTEEHVAVNFHLSRPRLVLKVVRVYSYDNVMSIFLVFSVARKCVARACTSLSVCRQVSGSVHLLASLADLVSRGGKEKRRKEFAWIRFCFLLFVS